MKETRNILGWLGMAEEQTIIRQCAKHIDEIEKTVLYLAEAIKAYIGGDLSAKTIAIENVKNSEHEADLTRLSIIRQLSEGLLLPRDRESLMSLTKNLDKIADGTNAAARLLGFIEHKLPDPVLKNMSISTDMIVKGAHQLREVIRAMNENKKKDALQGCEEIDRLEHDADDQKKLLIEAIIRAKLDATSVLLSFNLAEMLESVTDRIENAAEQIKMFVIKGQ